MRMFAIVILAVVTITSCLAPAYALEPVTDALLDKAEENAKDVIARAEAAGDAFAKALGEQMLQAIEALRESVHDTIIDAKEAAVDVQRQTFDNINVVLEQARQGEKVALTDTTVLVATVSDQVKSLPFADHAPEVMLYSPRVLVPRGVPEIPVHIIGPKLADSEASLSYEGSNVPLHNAREVELIGI